jgi:hypothetical protein
VNPGDRTRLIVAIATNLAIGQVAASWLGFPRWAGTVVAGGAMAAASMPDQLPGPARGVVELIVLPGNLVAQVLDDQAERLDQGEPADGL